MHRPVILPRRDRDEQGVVAILVAMSVALLCVAAALVLDFGVVRIDRQVDKSAADAAVIAGLHGLNAGDSSPHPYIGVCTALRYLNRNSDRFATVTDTSGSWTNAVTPTAGVTGNGCTDTNLRNKVCSPTDRTTWARYVWNGTWQGMGLKVTIQSGYPFDPSQWQEDALAATIGPNGDPSATGMQGCDQLAVVVEQHRKPGFGTLAGASDLGTAIRTVGRVKPVPGGNAPAMLLLKRTGCPVIETGSNSGGSFIHVLGAVSTNGLSQPGSIHADSDALGGCSGGSNQSTFLGKAGGGIVAYAAPLVASPGSPDPAKPGIITAVAAVNGMGPTFIRDSLDNVYASSALSSGGTKTEVQGRALIGRGVVDDRYFTGVKNALSGAAGVFGLAPSGFVQFPAAVDPCKPTQADVNALSLTAASLLFVGCNGKFVPNGPLTIPAGVVFFQGWLNPSAPLSIPNANHVYIKNQGDNGDAIVLSTGGELHLNNAAANLSGGLCSEGQSSSKNVLFVRSGDIKQSGTSSLQMCRTTVFMMGGSASGCVPSLSGTAPTTTPCPGINSGRGSGQFSQNGGDIDWTAPDKYDVVTLPDGSPDPTKQVEYTDVNGPEDLALWSESAGNNSSDTYNMTGGGTFHVRGVYMVPNADSFNIGGGASLNLKNAQFIVSSLLLNGTNSTLTMKVDPNSGITLPRLGIVGLVR